MNHLRDFKHLRIGERYEVATEFSDYDGMLHPVGESWLFRGHGFLPYEDGLSLFVSPDDATLRHVRLHWTTEDQGEIIDRLDLYIRLPKA